MKSRNARLLTAQGTATNLPSSLAHKTSLKTSKIVWCTSVFLLGAGALFGNLRAAETPAVAVASAKPAWLTDLGLGLREGYDDNVLLVSGQGLQPHGSWLTTVSPKVGVNLAPLLGQQSVFQTISLSYLPDYVAYHEAPSENYFAHKFNQSVKVKSGNFTASVDNALLYNDGNTEAATYALNQLSGAQANQNDKYRNFFAQAVPRERRSQIQDRTSAFLRYDWEKFFFRPTASLLFYDLNTDWHNTAKAPYLGYQDYPDRADVNGGADFGYKVTPNVALTLGYRYGYQYQEQFNALANADNHYSSSDYQRILVGLEGKLWNWLSVKLAVGPDFRDYDAHAYVADFHPVKYYGEAAFTATITPNQTLAFNYKEWTWVSASGLTPMVDTSYGLTYHWNATKQLGFDLGGKIMEANFGNGNDFTGSQPSRRDDRQYIISAGASYAFTPHWSANLAYNYNIGVNLLNNLPTALYPNYRDFDQQVVSLGVQYKF